VDEVEVLERLVAETSPSGSEESAVREFGRIARGLDYAVRIDRAGNGIAVRGRSRPRIVFLGHIDTVPGRVPMGRKRGRISGRGSVDAKGALAAALVAGSSWTGPGRLEIIAAVGEETDSRGARFLRSKRGVDAVIAGEPNRWDGIGVGYKGCLRVEATFDQPARHLTAPQPTSSDRALGWATAVRAAYAEAPDTPSFRTRTVKMASFRTEVARRDTTRVTVDLRLPPGTRCADAMAGLPRTGRAPELRVVSRIEPWETGTATPVVRALIRAIRAEGARPTLWRKSGTSDLNLVAPAWGCPAAVYGPGDPHLDHTARESLSERELRRSVRVLERAFADLASPGP